MASAPRITRELELDTDVTQDRLRPGAQIYPIPALEPVHLTLAPHGDPLLGGLPKFLTKFNDKLAGQSAEKDFIFYTLQASLQQAADRLVKSAHAPHVAIVALEPKTGRILALAQKSTQVKNLLLHTGIPAASIFKLVTTAAALERTALGPYSPVAFRGGFYTLNRWNYLPNPKRDRRHMTLAEALGRSCNPVFSHVAIGHLSPEILSDYAHLFWFNRPLGFELPLPPSSAFVPQDDLYEFGRTAAGFGEVTLTPIHAAALVGGIANAGVLERPTLIDKIVSQQGLVKYRSRPEVLSRMMQSSTARTMLDMMKFTTTIGTSRSEFTYRKRKSFGNIEVAAKTGTLTGVSPAGVNHWFVAAAPVSDPQIAVAIIVVDPPRRGAKASRIGKLLIEEYLKG